jgi:type I restriction enzyme, R subunit
MILKSCQTPKIKTSTKLETCFGCQLKPDGTLCKEEVAFYDALADNESAKQVLGDQTLKTMARELVDMIRRNVTIDWTLRENVQAKLRILVKRTLKKYHYPPDQQQKATDTVLDQAKLLCKDWAETC